ncbi:MAG: signal peptidase II [Candidatus Cloacimonetes bacterium]|nr:signal peptidase II [Candidatus Cloacimonadota bacterium]
MKKFYCLWITILVILLDQATKLRVSQSMSIGQRITVIGDFFRIHYITNTGAAFSISLGNESLDRIFFITSTTIAIIIFAYLLSKEKSRIIQCGYALILGGAIGNLIDRIAYGAVIDFFDFKFFSFIIDRWPVFNIADSAIVLAVILLLFDLFFPQKREEKAKQNINLETIEESL